MDDAKRLQLIAEAVRYCQRVADMGMPSSSYSKALREPVHFLWERRVGSKTRAARFRSRASLGLTFGDRLLVYDHAIPFKYLQSELLKLTDASADSVRDVLNKFSVVAFITREEDDALNRAGYGNGMPKNWDGVDPLARYKAVGIEIVDNTNASD
jgi:hypothetical protein